MENPSAQYEFTPEENKFFSTVARQMRIVGVFKLLVGVLVIVLSIWGLSLCTRPSVELLKTLPKNELQATLRSFVMVNALLVSGIIGGLLMALLSIWTLNAASSFRNIVKTQGNDITLLKAALRSLGRLYFVKCLVFLCVGVGVIYQYYHIIRATWVNLVDKLK